MKRLAIFTLGIIVVFGSLVSVQPANAQDNKDATKAPAVTAKENTDQSSKPNPTRVYQEGFMAIRAMHGARLAIFEGQPEEAVKIMGEAKRLLDAAALDETGAAHQTDLVPIDGQLELDETFVPSPEKAQAIQKANEHFQTGNANAGIEQLRVGEIEVTFSRVLLPLKSTKKRLDDAIKLAGELKYYEANLVLKAAEDGLETDSVSLIDFPANKPDAKSGQQQTKK